MGNKHRHRQPVAVSHGWIINFFAAGKASPSVSPLWFYLFCKDWECRAAMAVNFSASETVHKLRAPANLFLYPPTPLHAVGGKFTATTSSAETSGEGRLLTRWRRIEAEEGDYCACYCLFKGALRQMLSPHCALSKQSPSSA